jgi:hypothetical protein
MRWSIDARTSTRVQGSETSERIEYSLGEGNVRSHSQLDCWGVIYWGAPPQPILAKLDESKRFADAVTTRARLAFAS